MGRGPHPISHPPREVPGAAHPSLPTTPRGISATYLVHEDIDGRVQRRAALGGHGEEAEAHADIEPLTDAGAVQRLGLVLGLGRVSSRFLARLRTWGETHRAAEPRGWGTSGVPRPPYRPGPAAPHPAGQPAAGAPNSARVRQAGKGKIKGKKNPNTPNPQNPNHPPENPQTERSALPPRVRGDHPRSGGK